jgi:hypothetical protein
MTATPKDCSRLTQAELSAPDGANLTQAAKAMAAKHQLSMRTAYRHLARGTTPAVDRHIGIDGKTYPAHPRGPQPSRTRLERELALTWQALNRADQKACEQGLFTQDIDALRRIVATATEMLQRWEGAPIDVSGDHGM